MRQIKLLNNFIFLLLMSSTSKALAEAYLCVGSLSTGFTFDKATKEWSQAKFNVKDSKYLLSNGSGQWEWKRVGESTGIPCKQSFNESGYMHCEGLDRLIFNKKSLRYMLIYPVGYVNIGIIGAEGNDTPSMEIGKCSSM